MERAYGCLFCITGKEEAVVRRTEAAGVRAISARQEKHKSVKGKKERTEENFLPGYVFFEAERGKDPREWLPPVDVIRVLRYEDGSWELNGEDEEFAEWLFRYNGVLGFSRAYREGEKIRIASGPLKDMEGYITKVDKRGRSGQVEFRFEGRTIRMWLGFELVE